MRNKTIDVYVLRRAVERLGRDDPETAREIANILDHLYVVIGDYEHRISQLEAMIDTKAA